MEKVTMARTIHLYLLGDEGLFGVRIKYVGRGALAARLRARVGKYGVFYFKVANNENRAFRLECGEYHRYGKSNSLDNKIHPVAPYGFGKKCSEPGCNGERH